MTAVAAVLLVALGAAALEVVARVLERRMPAYRYWHDQLTTGKWHQLRALRREPPVDVVLAGSSQMLMALDPTAMPFRCYNAALYRAVPTVMAEWLAELVLPALRPRLVVWGVSILDLNDNGSFHSGVYERFSASPARRGGLRRWLLAHSAFARRWRVLLRRGPLPSADEPTSAKPLSALLGPMGQGLEYVGFTEYRLSDDKREFIETQIVDGFAMGGAQVAALRSGVASVRSAGADVVLVEMPCTDEFVEMYPNGAADLAGSRALLRSVAADLGVAFVEAPEELPQRWFADCVHLNGVGMAEWSARVGTFVAGRLAA